MSNDAPAPRAATPSTTTESVVGFDFSDALVPGIDRSASTPVVLVPECFGGVTRVALVGRGLEETVWEVVSADPHNPPSLERVSLGIAPDGFVTVVPLVDGAPLTGILVVNGPENLAMLSLVEGGGSVSPQGCG